MTSSNFPFELCLAAARDLWALAQETRSTDLLLVGAHQGAIVDFTGPKLGEFVERRNTDAGVHRSVADELEAQAHALAQRWTTERGNQDRINHSKWVNEQEANQSLWERGTNWVLSRETDYGPPPDDPPVPAPPRFEATRAPIHGRFE